MRPTPMAATLMRLLGDVLPKTVAGTIAGDNVIFIAPRNGTSAVVLRDELNGHLLEGAA